MLARLVHHTDDLQRPDAPLIALVTESALTVGQAGVELSFRSHRPTTLVGFRSPPAAAAQRRRLCTSAKGVGAAFALEKAVLLRLPPVCPAGFKKVTGSAVSCPESCLKIGIPA